MIKQVQKGGDQSTNIQASEVHIVGISYAEAHQIALDVFRANFLSLSDRAADIALARVEEITDKFLRKLKEQNEKGIAHSEDPDFQYALFTIQKEYARTGDEALGDLLVDILVDRTKHETRSILQIVLNESLSVAPKLTNDQLAALSLLFIFKYTINRGIASLKSFGEYLDRHVAPFVGLLSKNNSCYWHLSYSGCGSISIGSVNILKVLRQRYPGLFSKGFTDKNLQQNGIILPIESEIFIMCLHDGAKLQINALDNEVLRDKAAQLNLDLAEIDKLIGVNNTFLMSDAEIKDYIEQLRPYMKSVFDVWENSYMKNLDLTIVGIAIGHANIKRLVGEFTDLSIWIN